MLLSAEQQRLFDDAQKIVFLTGAGVSTASGIPDAVLKVAFMMIVALLNDLNIC